MKKQKLISLFLLSISAFLGSALVATIVYNNKKVGVLNVFYEKNSNEPILSLVLDSDKKMQKMLHNKIAIFNIKKIRIEDKKNGK